MAHKGIDIDALKSARTPRTAREVAEKKLRAELRGDTTAGSKKTGVDRDEELAEYYKKQKQEKLAAQLKAKQKYLLEDPSQSLMECACVGESRTSDLNYLLSKGVDLDDLINDQSALMAACQFNSQYGVEALVRAGAEVDLQSSTGVTALMVAVNAGNMAAVSFLLDHSGAKPQLADKSGHTALQVAYERGHTAIASKIVKALASPPARITTIAKEKRAAARQKAAEAADKAKKDKAELLSRTIAEVKEEQQEEQKGR